MKKQLESKKKAGAAAKEGNVGLSTVSRMVRDAELIRLKQKKRLRRRRKYLMLTAYGKSITYTCRLNVENFWKIISALIFLEALIPCILKFHISVNCDGAAQRLLSIRKLNPGSFSSSAFPSNPCGNAPFRL
ncbi:unnamed protein product [Angiostrongylus costaricensis]|uniref:HTH psq-type domain-containing protein n=1 Tax=Angiostrongylus costaricensis TaxID=334426 RepID=A0A0R3PLZ2_ANGCS|nr:unnamed protein product [Angiostrongylus costaricensis]